MRSHTEIHHKVRNLEWEMSSDIMQSEGLGEVITFDKAPSLLNIVKLIQRMVVLLIGCDSSLVIRFLDRWKS
jgi:hypothetical protein